MRKALPQQGTPWPQLEAELESRRSHDVQWRDGRAAVYVFHAGEDVLDVAHHAYGAYISENGLGPAAFPSLKNMEAEVLEMALDLQQAPEGGAGNMTSGGTESIIMAMKACRDWARAERPTQGTPNVVVPDTAHPAFNKGAHYLGMEVVRVPVTDALVGDPGRMAEAVTADTVMVVGSAPCFPFGVTDPIADLAEIAAQRGLWLHVDACVGGYIAPFIRLLGEPVPAYDFSIEGVSSMSADLHKYGYAAKGASTVMYRDKSLRDYQGFHFDEWACGHMYTPTMAGTRPGGAIAAAWAVMNYLGVEGYKARAQQIVNTRKRLEGAIGDLGLEVLGDPKLSLIAFGAPKKVDVDILAVGDGLYQAGWLSSRTSRPPGIHLMISPMHEQIIEDYIAVLGDLVARAKRGELGAGSTDISYA